MKRTIVVACISLLFIMCTEKQEKTTIENQASIIGLEDDATEKTISSLKNNESMESVKFKNIRFDPKLTPFEDQAMVIANAYGYTATLSIDRKLAQLLRLRVAQKNECAYCVILHSSTGREIGILPAKVDNISSWWNSELYSDVEKVALAYCDVLTEGTNKDFQKYHDALAKHFNEKEIAEIAAIIINMNIWTRLKLAQGQVPYQ